jgi:hypothetical protein
MPNEFSGIEKRLGELKERLARLEPLRGKKAVEYGQDKITTSEVNQP